ncbi:intestinal mucin-like protein [Pleurodeles waltl]|uniref:intestinal mucin-like protein n=1 Tax=Pleurodeles waltl TaxID=8319 RepID=UPI0037094DB0
MFNCRAKEQPGILLEDLNQNVKCDASGLVCYNNKQTQGTCLNYEVRFLCCTYEPCKEPLASDCKLALETLAWTEWFDKTKPVAGAGEFETITNIEAAGKEICKSPRDIQCIAESFPYTPISTINEDVICNKSIGLICFDAKQRYQPCLNYRVRFLCYSYNFDGCQTSTSIPSTFKTSRPTTSTTSSASTTSITPSSTSTKTSISSTTVSTAGPSSSGTTSISTLSSETTSSRYESTSLAPPFNYTIICKNATCVLDETNSTVILTVLCPSAVVFTCPQGQVQVEVYDVGNCCYKYECRDATTANSCAGPDGKTRQVGDSWITNCNMCTCTTKNKVTCSKFICGTLPNLTCTEEGFEAVSFFAQEDPCCPKRECRCNPNLCPKKQLVCALGFQLTVEFGLCCARLICVPKGVCVQNNVEYKPNMIVPSTQGPCFSCTCSDRMNPNSQLNEIKCSTQMCAPCPPGQDRVAVEGVCCGKCVHVACVVQNKKGSPEIHQVGDTWVDPDEKCKKFRCDQVKEQIVVATEKDICPPFDPEDCEEDTIEASNKSCCLTCQAKLKKCALTKVSENINVEGCFGVAEIGICIGNCLSTVRYSIDGKIIYRSCACCKEMTMTKKSTILSCRNGKQIKYEYPTIASCGCIHADCVK